MKKYLFLATAAIAALASCTSDDFVGDKTAVTSQNENGAISFGTGVNVMTRADHVGADAASMLNNKFIVGGFKGATGTSTVFTDGTITTNGIPSTGLVFDNYQVNWTVNTAGTTQSNTSDWEYVGTSAPDVSGIKGKTQSIKYWDYTAEQYDFIAYSTSNATVITTGEPSTGQVLVSTINALNAGNSASGAYTLKGSKDDLAKCYIADMVTAYNPTVTGQPKFQDEIKFKFRSLASKVRMAIYETIPGYSVKDVKFYTNSTDNLGTATETNETKATLFTTGTTSNNFYTAGEYKVYFPTIGKENTSNTDYNKAHVTFTPNSVGGKTTTQSFSTLNYTNNKDYNEKTGTQFLGRTSDHATFAGTSPYYLTVLPNEEGAVLELRIDYTLESIDGSGEEIKVFGATAFVPAIYAAWKSNYAYTYIFKISDNTNGWTKKVNDATSTDPAGLYPITFDAVVIEAEDQDNTQSTITTVATPSITTYQVGHVNTDEEYDKDKGDIYVQVMDNNESPATLKNDLHSKGKLYSVTGGPTGGTVTESDVMDALNIYETSTGTVVTGRNKWILTDVTTTASVDANITEIPGADGNNITVTAHTAAKFTPTAGTTYAYVYDATPTSAPTETVFNTAVTFTGTDTKPDDWKTAYFKDFECTTSVDDSDFTAGTFYKKYTNKNKVYAVKIIRIKAGS